MSHTDNLHPATGTPERDGSRPTTAGDDLLARVEATVAAIAEKLSPVPQLERSLRRWRISFFLLGAVTAGVIGLGLHMALPVVKGAEAVAMLSAPGSEPAYLVALSADGHDLVIRRLGAAPKRPLHLWLQRGGSPAIAVGPLAETETARLPRPADLRASDLATTRLFVAPKPANDGAPAAADIVSSGRLVSVTP